MNPRFWPLKKESPILLKPEKNLIKSLSKKLDDYKFKAPTLIIPEVDTTKLKEDFVKAFNKMVDGIFELTNEIEDFATGDAFPKSALLKAADFAQIRKWLDKEWSRKKFKLVFRGTRDGMTSTAFHQFCDNKGPIVTVIKSKTYDKIFGGFVDQAYTNKGNYINTQKSFIFSITNKEKYVITDMASHSQYAAYDNASYGPTFGGGHDIYLSGDFTSSSNYCNRYSYNFTDNASLVGAYNFQAEEVEVYSLDK